LSEKATTSISSLTICPRSRCFCAPFGILFTGNMHARTPARTHTRAHTRTHVNTHLLLPPLAETSTSPFTEMCCLHTHAHTCTHTRTRTRTHAHTRTHNSCPPLLQRRQLHLPRKRAAFTVHTHTRTHAHTHAHTRTHTHTHVHTQLLPTPVAETSTSPSTEMCCFRSTQTSMSWDL